MVIEYEVVLYSCSVCNTTKSSDDEIPIIEIAKSFCMVCKFYNTYKKLGKFILKKVIE